MKGKSLIQRIPKGRIDMPNHVRSTHPTIHTVLITSTVASADMTITTTDNSNLSIRALDFDDYDSNKITKGVCPTYSRGFP